jgi:hypothetical protein
MPKFTLIKEPEFEGDSKVEMSFSIDSSAIAHEYFDDFLRAAGFVLPESHEQESTGFFVRGDLGEMEWDANGELKRRHNPVRLVE